MTCDHCGEKKNTAKRYFRAVSSRPFWICGRCGKAQPPRYIPAAGKPQLQLAILEYEKLKLALRDVRLKIFVWGPNPKGDRPESVKRRELKKELTDAGYLALYSEETTVDYRVAPLNLQELMQLRDKPLVVCIAGSPGPIAEAETLGHLLGTKFLLWLPDAWKKGYTAQGLASILRTLGRQPEFYTDSDLASCAVVTATLSWAEEWRNVALVIEEQRRQLAEIAPARG